MSPEPPSQPLDVGMSARRESRGRLRGVDAARALAIVGMVMVHFGPTSADADLADHLYGVTHGRAAILFAVIAGVGVSLLAGDRTLARRRRAYAKLGLRVAVLLPLGLWLQELPSGVAVILHYYALYFVVAALAITWSDRVVLAVAGTSLAAGPLLVLAGEMYRPEWQDTVPVTIEDWSAPTLIARELLLTGTYPLATWTAPVLFGLWLGRRDLRSRALAWRMVLVGALAVAVAHALEALLLMRVEVSEEQWGWADLATTAPHSQMPLWLVQAVGAAVAVLAICLLACDRFPRLCWPAVATGQMALTIYVAHVLLLSHLPDLFFRDTVEAATLTVARFALLAVAFAVAWRAVVPRGPLELVLNLPWERRSG